MQQTVDDVSVHGLMESQKQDKSYFWLRIARIRINNRKLVWGDISISRKKGLPDSDDIYLSKKKLEETFISQHVKPLRTKIRTKVNLGQSLNKF